MGFSLNKKIERMLMFLVGMRNPVIFSLLSERGFTQEDLKEGWDLFLTSVGYKMEHELSVSDAVRADDARSLLRELDEWENTWFPVAEATLEHRFPDIYTRIFNDLSRTRGKKVITSVKTLIERVEGLKSSAKARDAFSLLEKRGLDRKQRDRARLILEELSGLQERSGQDSESRRIKKEQDMALEKAWSWYKEWSRIARTVLKRNDVLIRLGIREHRLK